MQQTRGRDHQILTSKQDQGDLHMTIKLRPSPSAAAGVCRTHQYLKDGKDAPADNEGQEDGREHAQRRQQVRALSLLGHVRARIIPAQPTLQGLRVSERATMSNINVCHHDNKRS